MFRHQISRPLIFLILVVVYVLCPQVLLAALIFIACFVPFVGLLALIGHLAPESRPSPYDWELDNPFGIE